MAKQNALIKQKFGDRDLNSLTERSFRQMYKELPFDMNLISANDEKIPVHYFVMVLFSPYLRNKFKGELIFKPNIDVLLKNFSHEILKEVVQFIYFGNVWIDSNMTTEFVAVVHFLELLSTCSNALVPCIGFEEEKDDGFDGYDEFSRDPASIALHENGKIIWDCEFSGCTSKTVTKVIGGVIMIKSIQPIHSTECWQDQACLDSLDFGTDDQTEENNGKDSNQNKLIEYPALSSDDSDSFLDICSPEGPSH